MTGLPRRIDGFDVTPVEDGAIIYDHAADRVHYLNPTAELVLALCDGASDAAEIARLLQDHFALPEPPRAEVEALIAQLVEEGLVRNGKDESAAA